MRRHGKQRRPRAWCGEHRHLGSEVAIAASSTGSSSARHSGHVLRAARGRAQARAQGCSVSACSNEEHRADPCARVACARGCTHCSAGRIRRADTRVLAPPTANPRPAPAAARPRRQARPVELVPARLPAVGLHHRHAHHHARAPAELIVADGADGLGGPVRAADPRGRSAAPSPVLRVLCEHARRASPSPFLRVLFLLEQRVSTNRDGNHELEARHRHKRGGQGELQLPATGREPPVWAGHGTSVAEARRPAIPRATRTRQRRGAGGPQASQACDAFVRAAGRACRSAGPARPPSVQRAALGRQTQLASACLHARPRPS